MTELTSFIEAYIADCQIENVRVYLERGRRLADRSTDALNAAWVETYRAARGLEDARSEDALGELRCEFDLRGVGPPMHLVAAEAELFAERFRRRLRNSRPSPVEVDEVERDLQRFRDRLGAPKN